jgi:hypothetical protein
VFKLTGLGREEKDFSPPNRQGREGKRGFPFSSKLGAIGGLAVKKRFAPDDAMNSP